MGGQRNGRQDERTVIHRPVIRQAGRGEERDARDDGSKDENGVAPPHDKQDEAGNETTRRAEKRQRTTSPKMPVKSHRMPFKGMF